MKWPRKTTMEQHKAEYSMCLMSPVNSTSNGQCAEMGSEDRLFDVIGLDFSTEGLREFGDEERGPWKNHHWFESRVQRMCGEY